jgi:glucose/arabinose dehydrogenase
MSYDETNGRILVADVGQNEIEEINVLQNGGNYGWRVKEGTFFFNQATGSIASEIPFEPLPPALIDPIAQYDHGEGRSVIGGFVYQGSLLPQFRGHYLFGDFGTSFGEPSGLLLAMAPDGTLTRLTLGLNARDPGGWVKGFGQDASGEIYLCTSDQLAPTGSGGKVWRFIPLVHIAAVERLAAGSLRIEVLADQDGGTVSLRRSPDLIDFSASIPLTPLAPSRFEAQVPTNAAREFFRGELNP